ncbi:MAG: hypothetical protein AABX73_01330 [Nanoarchaeota archaeon]
MGINGLAVVYTNDDGTYRQIARLAIEVGFSTRHEKIGQFEAILDPTIWVLRNNGNYNDFVGNGVYRFFSREAEWQKAER